MFRWYFAACMAICWILLPFPLFDRATLMAQNQPPNSNDRLEMQAADEFAKGNFRNAIPLYAELLGQPKASIEKYTEYLRKYVASLQNSSVGLGKFDSFLEELLQKQSTNHQLRAAAAQCLLELPAFGVVGNGKFHRQPNEPMAGVWVERSDQDRATALRWLSPFMGNIPSDTPEQKMEAAKVYAIAFSILRHHREYQTGWRLQQLTDLAKAADYLDLEPSETHVQRRAPVDVAGNPVLYAVPKSWSEATSDGERIRWLLAEIDELDAAQGVLARWHWANFLQQQFGVETLADQPWLMPSFDSDDDDGASKHGIFDIHTLEEDETIARLANGIRRFKLPDEHNPIRLYQSILKSSDRSLDRNAIEAILNIYVNRRQYAQAVAFYKQKGSPSDSKWLIESIVEPRGTFDHIATQPAGKPASLGLVFRNAKQAEFRAMKVDVEKLFAATKKYYQGSGGAPFPNIYATNIAMPFELFANSEKVEAFIEKEAAKWSLPLEPRPGHWDRRIEVKTPLQDPGLYVVTASFDGGKQVARCLFWIQNTALVQSQIGKQQVYFLADALSGEPLPNVNVEFFGYQQTGARGDKPIFQVQNFAKKSDANGWVRLDGSSFDPNFVWIVVARDGKQRLVVDHTHPIGQFDELSQSNNFYRETKAYGVSDRPVYRPGDKVLGKVWVATPSYDPGQPSAILSRQVLTFCIQDPSGQTVFEKQLTTDEFGGAEFEFPTVASIKLGYYSAMIKRGDASSPSFIPCNLRFRVEEYRKPEFEVSVDGPKQGVGLGETIHATVKAKYYFGSPVTDANVVVKVSRTAYRDSYFPIRPYDWCYGPGYWWVQHDYAWYPGWRNWRCFTPPQPPWMHWGPWGNEPPELVLEQSLTLDASGEAKIAIDTAIAKAFQGDMDHRYSIQVEVRDASRRTITAQGEVFATRKPFQVYVWTDRSYYEVGQAITVSAEARVASGNLPDLKGTLQLLRISYTPDGKPSEKLVQEWPLATDAERPATQTIEAADSGQYRLKVVMSDGKRSVEAGQILVIRGKKDKPSDFRFSGLELTPNQPHYKVGDQVRLLVSADHANAVVLLMVRGEYGVHPEPQVVRLDGKSKIVEIPVKAGDQPNFFVEAMTIYEGKFYNAIREILVPPEDKTLLVETQLDQEEYKPGDEASLTVQVLDPNRKPVKGSLAVAIYDRSVEAIAADVVPIDIREYFWKWRRGIEGVRWQWNNLRLSQRGNWLRFPNYKAWQPLGLFGNSVADDDLSESFGQISNGSMGPGGPGRLGGGGGGRFAPPGAPTAGAAPMEGAAPMMARSVADASADYKDASAAPGNAGEATPVILRSEFADTAFWIARIETDEQGIAKVPFKLPDNLASWKVRTWAVSAGLRVGSQATETVTRKKLMARLQMPRFLVENDRCMLSTLVNNEWDEAIDAEVELTIDGETQLQLLDRKQFKKMVRIEPHSQARVDWECRAIASGEARVRVTVVSKQDSDAMELPLPILVYGTNRTESFAGTVRSNQELASVSFDVPAKRQVEQSNLIVRLSPSLAASMIDALPFLVNYPHGCTEQTLNRFLPTVITQRVLQEMQVDLASLAKQRSNLNAQELGTSIERQQGLPSPKPNPVYDEAEVVKMVEAGVNRLIEMQNSDGGWGWFSGQGERSWPHTTAVVVRGLTIAQKNDVAIVPGVLERGLAWLENYQAEQITMLQNAAAKKEPWKQQVDDLDALVFQILVSHGRVNPEMQNRLFETRSVLSVYSKAMLALATHAIGDAAQTQQLRSNIEEMLVEDAGNETAYVKSAGLSWYWYNSGIEANAAYLKLLCQMEPKGPTASRVVKYLLNHRRHGSYWDSTRDTALVIEAFADYLRATGETQASTSVEVMLDDQRLGRIDFTPENLFSIDNTIRIRGSALKDGNHQLTIRRVSGGNIYWNAYISHFTQEAEIAPAGLEVQVIRKYYLLTPIQKDLAMAGNRGQVGAGKKASFDRKELVDLAQVPSGSLVEVELQVTSKNRYEYLLIEDPKVASMEPVEVQSGYDWNGNLGIYREFRDQRVSFYVRDLPQGSFSWSYRVRAEAPGEYTGLPTVIRGMYAPELVGNSADFDLQIQD